MNLGAGCYYPFSLTKCTELIANNDIGNNISSSIGGTAYNNILVNDTLNGIEILPSQVQITLINPPSGITLNNANILVAAGTAAGNYTLTYQICDLTDLSRCQQANGEFYCLLILKLLQEIMILATERSSTGIVGNILKYQ